MAEMMKECNLIREHIFLYYEKILGKCIEKKRKGEKIDIWNKLNQQITSNLWNCLNFVMVVAE